MTYPVAETTDILDDLSSDQLEDASKGQRFLNYLIDVIGFYILVFSVSFFLAFIIGDEFAESLDRIPPLVDRLVSLVIYGVFMFAQELLTQGRSLGKFVTNTKAVDWEGQSLTYDKILKRSLSRMVPFEPFSGLGTAPWHDTWSQTRVVKRK